MTRVIFLSLIFFIACATPGKFDDHCKARIGQSIDAVILHIGAPDKTVLLGDGKTMYQWDQYGAYTTYGGGNFSVSNREHCRLSYVAGPDRLISAYRWDGDCRSY